VISLFGEENILVQLVMATSIEAALVEVARWVNQQLAAAMIRIRWRCLTLIDATDRLVTPGAKWRIGSRRKNGAYNARTHLR
jgi:hypothetical protein